MTDLDVSGRGFGSCEELPRWPVADLEGFRAKVRDHFEVCGTCTRVLGQALLAGA